MAHVKIKSGYVLNVIEALNTFQHEIPRMNNSERRELGRVLTKIATLDESDGDEGLTVDGLDEISLALIGVARQLRDEFGLPENS